MAPSLSFPNSYYYPNLKGVVQGAVSYLYGVGGMQKRMQKGMQNKCV